MEAGEITVKIKVEGVKKCMEDIRFAMQKWRDFLNSMLVVLQEDGVSTDISIDSVFDMLDNIDEYINEMDGAIEKCES